MSLIRMIVVAVALALALTWLLILSLQPSDAEYLSVEHALAGISAGEVGLQRDVLRARGGLLLNYDPIVTDVARLHSNLKTLEIVSHGAAAETMARIAASIEAEEDIAEAFKTTNALAQNSFGYFTLLSGRLAQTEGAGDLAARTGALTATVLQLSRQPTPDAIAETDQRLADIAAGPAPAGLEQDVASLVLHGRLLADLLPTLDRVTGRFQTSRTLELRRVVRTVFEGRQKSRERLARHIRRDGAGWVASVA